MNTNTTAGANVAPVLVRIPITFYIDHADRGLATPDAVRETKRHVWIDVRDPALGELVDDAKHYAHADGPDQCPESITRGAKNLLRALAGVAIPVAPVAPPRRAPGRPRLAVTKQLISIRYSREAIEAFRATGDGWQTRIADTVERAAKRIGR
jgi:uncharacterized protein (DUF4415 family)